MGKSKNVGVFLAGNIPLVGFHDFLCTLILGHTFVAKTSSSDSVLFKYLIDILIKIEPRFKSKSLFHQTYFYLMFLFVQEIILQLIFLIIN